MSHLALLLMTACTGEPPVPEDATVVAVGDSIFDWFSEEGASIPDVVGEELGLVTYNASISGTQLGGDDEDSIPNQLPEGDWGWVVMDGGGNDLNDRCGCGDCADVMDALVSPDSTEGVLPDFVAELTEDGAQVALMGYPQLPQGAEYGFDRCGDELIEYSGRQAALADAIEGVIFIDAREVVDGQDLSLFDEDLVHPSEEGARRMGALIAERIEEAQGR